MNAAGGIAAQDLLEAARAARANAYAPYSRFAVGAAVRTASGAVFAGANVENAAYPIGTCAEAGAIATMVAAGERKIVEALVLGEGRAPVAPCGACRQRLLEFADGDTPIHIASPDGILMTCSLEALLPHAFALTRRA